MNRIIKLVCTQTTANYRKPTAIDIQESYPLPPYSTVIGMVHNLCGFTSYHPMKVSVQGEYKSSHTDIYTRYMFGIAYDQTRHQAFTINEKGGKDGITRGLGYADTLVDINLILHIQMENEEDTEFVFQKLKKPNIYPSLGRFEDLLKIESVEFVEIEYVASIVLKNDAYIPMDNLEKDSDIKNIVGVMINLNKVYDNDYAKNKIRRWQKVRAKYLNKMQDINADAEIIMCEKSNSKDKIGVFLA